MSNQTILATKKFIFIAGLHRSGTTILASELAQHKHISGLENTNVRKDEGQFLQNVYPLASKYGGPGKFALNSESYIDENSPLATDQNAINIFESWCPFWDINKIFLLEKSPPNLLKTKFLQKIFKNSFFITVIRHPIAVSLATQKWSQNTLDDLFAHWLKSHELFYQDEPFLKKSLIIKYEDLIAAPKKEMDRAYNLLDLESPINEEYNFIDSNAKYFESWQRMEGSFFKKKEIHKLQLKYENKFNQLGYSLKLK